MNRQLFLQRLSDALAETSKIPSHEIKRICEYFDEMIEDRLEDGLSEEEAISTFDDIETLVKTVLEDMEMHSLSVNKDATLTNKSGKTEKIYSESFKSIILSTKNENVSVYPSPDNDIHLIYVEDDYEAYDINVGENSIIIEKIVKKFKLFGFRRLREFEIYLPKNYSANLKLTTSNSSINCKAIKLNDGEFKTSNSNIKLLDITANLVDAKTSNSNITLENCNFIGDISAKTSNSQIKAENVVSGGEFIAKTSNSKIEAKKVSSTADLRLKTSNGKIAFDEIVGHNIELITSNGNIEGNIFDKEDNFTIDPKTSNAKSNLNHKVAGERTLIAHTSNAKINVDFLQ